MATATASNFAACPAHVHYTAESRSSGATFFSRNIKCVSNVSLQGQGASYKGLWSAQRRNFRLFQGHTRENFKKVVIKAIGHGNYVHKGPKGVIICGTRMNLVFISSAVAPWSKTGGLGDVLGGLPPAMVAGGHRVMIVSPQYDQYKDSWDTNVSIDLKVGEKIETIQFFHSCKRGVDCVFIDHPLFLEKVWGKIASKIYGLTTREDYQDNQLHFSLLCQAAIEAPRVLNLSSNEYFSGPYGEDVVFIANDWHTTLLPCYLKSIYKPAGSLKNAKVVFFIHNIAYQGRYASSDFSLLNLPEEFKSSFDFIDGYNKPVKGRKINWMKVGILESDRVLVKIAFTHKHAT